MFIHDAVCVRELLSLGISLYVCVGLRLRACHMCV